MNREVVDRWCERGILGLTLAILVLMPLAFGGRPQLAAGSVVDFLLLDPFLAAQWLMVPLLVLSVARLWVDPKPRFLLPPVCWAVLAFSLYALGRYLTADIEYAARQEWLRVLVYACLFFVILNHLHRQETTQIVSFTLIFLAMAISFYGIYQFMTDSNRVWHVFKPYAHRASGTYISPNHLGGFLEMILPLGLGYTVVGRFKPTAKVFLGYASLVILAGIVVSFSRGTWIASAVALLLFFGVVCLRRGYRLPAFALLAVMIIAGIYCIPRGFVYERRVKQFISQSAEGKVDDDLRFALWRPAVQVWQENVWWGAGPAHFDSRFGQHRPEEVQLRPDRVHNDYLNTLADWGLVGAALVASVWLLLAAGVWKSWHYVRKTPADLGSKKGSSKYAFLLGASLGLVAILVHSAVDYNMHVPANALLALALIALLSGHVRFATERYWLRPPVWAKALASLILLAALTYLGQESWRHSVQNFWLARASRAPQFSSEQVRLLEKAFGAEPMNAETTQAIGEALRRQSQEGGSSYQGQEGVDYRKLGQQSLDWFGRSIKLNPWRADCYVGCGWCLDWLDRSSEAAPYFDHAEQLDPNNYYVVAHIGLHHFQSGSYAAARNWFERSLRLEWRDNPIASTYLQVVNQRLLEAATASSPPLALPRP